ncbi:MAG: hypothetical protein ABI702_09195 [Burkholderiales bacterium]
MPTDWNDTMSHVHSSAAPGRGAGPGVAGSAPRADARLRRVAFCAVALSMGLGAYASANRLDRPAADEVHAGPPVTRPIAADDPSVPAASEVFRAGRVPLDEPAAPTF